MIEKKVPRRPLPLEIESVTEAIKESIARLTPKKKKRTKISRKRKK
jgi:hypothetical protein